MFGLEFLFSAALWALPLAGMPILLHLLFRRKSPIVPFSTLRFVKMSLQRTAARKKVQRWLLLATRALLLLLLIWAIAQPAKMLASGWFGGGNAPVAAIVVDTSYSMLLEDEQLTFLNKAGTMVEDLLRDQMKTTRVTIFKSQPAPANDPEQLLPSAQVLSQWTPLKPQPNPQPLVQRIASAIELLKQQQSDQKWLIVVSDFQSKEFPHPMPDFDGRVILLDLHPPEARSAGVSSVTIDPPQPIAGIGAEAVITITGRPADSRAVVVKVADLAGQTLFESAPSIANLDGSGRATLRFPLRLSPQRWQLISANLPGGDAMTWDDSRTMLVELPPRQNVMVLQSAASSAQRFVKLALDPSEGKLTQWPLAVTTSTTLTGKENVAVLTADEWPAENQANQLRELARGGGTVILFLKPGLEDTWSALAESQKNALLALLPSIPFNKSSRNGGYRAAVGQPDSLLAGLTDDKFQVGAISTRQFVPFGFTEGATTILNLVQIEPTPGARPFGLLFRKALGRGQVYCWSTLPDSRLTNLATHPLFLPLMVRMSLRPPSQSAAANVELGQALTLSGPLFSSISEMQINSPDNQTSVVKSLDESAGHRFEFITATVPGLYQWRRPGDPSEVAITNVQLPADESQLSYRPALDLAGSAPNVVVARSISELAGKLSSISEPQAKWSMPIAIVLFLLCLEALMGSASQLWKPLSLKSLLSRSNAAAG